MANYDELSEELKKSESERLKLLHKVNEDERKIVAENRRIEKIKALISIPIIRLEKANKNYKQKSGNVSEFYLLMFFSCILTLCFASLAIVLPILFPSIISWAIPLFIVLTLIFLTTSVFVFIFQLPHEKKQLKEAEVSQANAQAAYDEFLKSKEQVFLEENTVVDKKSQNESMQCAENTLAIDDSMQNIITS